MIENYIVCHCYKEAKKIFPKKEGIGKNQLIYICGNNQRCNFFLRENQPFITYKDIIEDDSSYIFDIEREKRYPLSFHMMEYEYLIPPVEGVNILGEEDHPTYSLTRRSPFCFITSNYFFSSFFIEHFENEWKIPSALFMIKGVDIVTNENYFCHIVPCLSSWSNITDSKLFLNNEKRKNNEFYSLDKKKIGKSYHYSQDEYKNKIEWDKHWIELHGTDEKNIGWLWNAKIKYVLFEEKEGFFIVKRKDITKLINSLGFNYNTSLLWYKNNCTFDPRKGYKTPFINPCNFSRYDYKIFLKKDDLKNIIVKEWKYK